MGIDVGTTNVKVALVTDDGTVVGRASRRLHTVGAPPVATQDTGALWDSCVAAVRELTRSHPTEAATVAAVGTCSQYSSLAPVDAEGRATAPMIVHLDGRGGDRCRDVLHSDSDALMTWAERHGLIPSAGSSLAHLLHLTHDAPDVLAASRWLLEAADVVTLRLTGRATTTQGTAFAGMLCDNRTTDATDYDATLVGLAGVATGHLAPIVPVGSAVGTIRPEIASGLGLPPAAVVAASMNDSQAGAAATGAATPGRAGVAMGTTAVVLVPSHGFVTDLTKALAAMPGPQPGQHLVWAENGLAGGAVEHLLSAILRPAATGDGFAELDDALAASAPGAGGLLFLPWLTGSLAPSPDGRARGAVVGIGLDTTRADVVRATVEGTAHNLRYLLAAVADLTGRPIDELALVGGAARSVGWAQVIADVTDRPVRTTVDPEYAVARAAALLALDGAAGVGATSAETPLAEPIVPDPAARARCDDAHACFVAVADAVRRTRPDLRSGDRTVRPG